MNKISLFHLDDDSRDIEVVKKLIEPLEEFEYVGATTSTVHCLQIIDEKKPDVLLLDIEMPEENGLSFALKLKKTSTQVVFLTAHTGYALRAFEACAMHYILKPATTEAFEEILFRYTKTNNKNLTVQQEKVTELLSNYFNKESYPKRIFINNLYKTTVLDLENVIYLTSSGSYTTFVTIDGAKHTASKLLKLYAEALENHPDFLRIHRGHIINKKFVKAILRNKHKTTVQMGDDEELEISPNKKDAIYKELLK